MSTPAPQDQDPRRWKGLAVLASSLLIVIMDMTILNVAIPELSRDLRPDSVQLLWIVDVYSLVVAGLLVAVSGIADRWGRRRMLLCGYAVFGIASALVLAVDSPAAMIAMRVLLGVGGAMIMPSTLAMIRSLFPDAKERATALGLWGATAGVGGGIGPIAGGALLEFFPWQAAFLINVPVMALGVVMGLRLLPESRSPRPAPLDWTATALASVGLVALIYSVKDLGKDGITGLGITIAIIAVVALSSFVWRCLRSPDPMIDLRLFSNAAFSAGVLGALCSTFAMTGLMLLAAQWLQLVEGMSALQAGLALLPAAIGGAVASTLAPVVAARIGARTVLAGALLIGAGGFLVFWLAPAPLSQTFALLAFFLVGMSTGSLALGSAVIMAATPVDRAGNAAAIEEVSYEIGATTGVAVLGSAAAASYRGDLPAQVTAGLPEEAADAVRESLGGAIEVARQLGPAGDALANAAQTAFTDALTGVGLIGALILAAAASVVWLLVGRDLDVTGGGH